MIYAPYRDIRQVSLHTGVYIDRRDDVGYTSGHSGLTLCMKIAYKSLYSEMGKGLFLIDGNPLRDFYTKPL